MKPEQVAKISPEDRQEYENSLKITQTPGGFSSMYVYTDIVDAQFVGDVKVHLLRIVNIEGEYGNTVHASFLNLQYVPVKVNYFETIGVNIKNDQNKNVSFEFGKSIATFHFRQKRSQFFI
jgi:hypothetical protein